MEAYSCLLQKAVIILQTLQCTLSVEQTLVPFGSLCSSLNVTCGKFGSYQGGFCDVEFTVCECRLFPNPCVEDDVCCSGKCNNKVCSKSVRRNDPCMPETCDIDKGFDCRLIPADNVTLVLSWGPSWGLCERNCLRMYSIV